MKVETPKFGNELIRRILHLPHKMPKKIQIEITNRCNLSCEICPREKFNLPNTDIKIDVFKQILSKLKDVEVVLPVGWGEPFLNKDIGDIIDLIKENGHLIKLPTNGKSIDEQLTTTAHKIDYLTFSVDEMHLTNRNSVFNTIVKLIQERKDRNSNKPYITVQLVLYKSNNEIFDIIRKAKLIGVDRVNILRPNIYDNKNNISWKKRKAIYKNAELVGKQIGMRIDMFEYALFTGVKRFLWKYFKGIFRINSWCPRLSDFLYITIEGKVTPCCYLPRYIVGDLMTQNINEIWHGETMNRFRSEHKQICKNCHILKIR